MRRRSGGKEYSWKGAVEGVNVQKDCQAGLIFMLILVVGKKCNEMEGGSGSLTEIV